MIDQNLCDFRPFSDSDDGIVFEQDNNDYDWFGTEDSKDMKSSDLNGKVETSSVLLPKLQFLYIQVLRIIFCTIGLNFYVCFICVEAMLPQINLMFNHVFPTGIISIAIKITWCYEFSA